MLEVLLALAGGAAFGAFVSWDASRKRLRAQAQAEQQTSLERDEARSELTYVTNRLAVRDEQLRRAAKDRDEYARIASNRELPPPQWNRGHWARKVWKDRRYSGHPSHNLAALRGDFEVFRDEHVLLSLDIGLLGGWKSRLGGGTAEPAAGEVTSPLSAGQTMIFEGPADRVLAQVITFIEDDDTGFMEVGPDEQKVWRDADSPMVWLLTVDVLQGYATPPAIELVEVLKIQQEIVERVVERPVVRTVPPEITTTLCRHTQEEIITLIEAVLEVRELDREPRLQATTAALRPALEGLESASPKALLAEPSPTSSE